jgi:hypothetical protein
MSEEQNFSFVEFITAEDASTALVRAAKPIAPHTLLHPGYLF